MKINEELADQILLNYDEAKSSYAGMVDITSNLLQTIISGAGIALHSVTSRCKDRQSLAKKLGVPGKSYKTLSDVTDIAGIRLTTYFADDVDKVAEIVRSEFAIDEGSSVDKRVQADPDRFGYLSLHYIAKLSKERSCLSEYKRFDGLKFEIQIRSILQHAWAEIEHDLGYKSGSAVPAEIKRRFARVSGLLELADSEFSAIRQQLDSYEKELPSLLAVDKDIRPLDLPTLNLLMETDPDLRLLDLAVAEGAGAIISNSGESAASWTVEKLELLGVSTVGDLKDFSRKHLDDVRGFSEYWARRDLGNVQVGIGIFYLCYVLLWASKDKGLARQFVAKFWGEDSDYEQYDMAADIMNYDPSVRGKRPQRMYDVFEEAGLE